MKYDLVKMCQKGRSKMPVVTIGSYICFRETISSPILKQSATFEYSGIYPNQFKSYLRKPLLGLKIYDEVKFKKVFSYEDHQASLVVEVNKKNLSGTERLQNGMVFSTVINTQNLLGSVKEIREKTVLIDLNPPFANNGETNFRVKVFDIRPPKKEELARLEQGEGPTISLI